MNTLDAIQTLSKQFSPIPLIELETAHLYRVRVDVSLVNCATNQVVPNGISRDVDGLHIEIGSLGFANIRLSSSIADIRGDHKLRISIGGVTAESNNFLIQQ